MAYPAYSPVTQCAGGDVTVQLAADHPGFSDPAYRARRNQLAALALSWQPGQPIPVADYRGEEHRVWEVVSRRLAPLHERYAATAFLEGKDALALPDDAVPLLDDVTARLAPLTGFRYYPVAGLAPLRHFYCSFAEGTFWSTQYLRHPSVPLYTPEPDIIHEVIGHANALANPLFARLYRLMGAAVAHAPDDEALRYLSRVFWFTLEFGVVRERGELRAVGAGILSSVGEIQAFQQADIRRADFDDMAHVEYDITHYQPVLYAFDSPAELEDTLSDLFNSVAPTS